MSNLPGSKLCVCPGVKLILANIIFLIHSVRREDLETLDSANEPGSPDQTLATRFHEQLAQLYHPESGSQNPNDERTFNENSPSGLTQGESEENNFANHQCLQKKSSRV